MYIQWLSEIYDLRDILRTNTWGNQHACSALAFHLYKYLHEAWSRIVRLFCGSSCCGRQMENPEAALFLGSNDENEVEQTDEWSWLSFCLCDLYLIWLWREAGRPQSFDSSQIHTHTHGAFWFKEIVSCLWCLHVHVRCWFLLLFLSAAALFATHHATLLGPFASRWDRSIDPQLAAWNPSSAFCPTFLSAAAEEELIVACNYNLQLSPHIFATISLNTSMLAHCAASHDSAYHTKGSAINPDWSLHF